MVPYQGPEPIQCSTSVTEHLRLALKLFRGEPAISRLVWLFTATHSSSDSFSTLTGSGLHVGLATLHPGHGWIAWFRVYGMQLNRPIRTRFPYGSAVLGLTSLHAITRRFIILEARRHPGPKATGLRPVVGTRFQVLFHSPSGVLFTFPSRYWYTIGH